ncbi:MAG: hypothetical protein KBD01_10175 [Acidobacteria bacterium]|nr:hypothetical protein [Acidobacteriota bacterium]
MRARVLVPLAVCAVFLPGLARAQAQEPDLRGEIEALKKGQQQILRQLDEIKKMLQTPARPAAPDVRDKVFNLGDNPRKGSDAAKITLMEFTDYQ